ncbi:hypothetical protein IFM89_031365 [Coptis chinensis]|uniref:PTBP1-like RNA recognition motif 2 domain-containing protein n=1 Tax=Coptis chinensis TaxID=261450 RepID=A0A835IZB6_9MAGN|nr:hypothetical protein IFM89_031365 [Coptis chinensis]
MQVLTSGTCWILPFAHLVFCSYRLEYQVSISSQPVWRSSIRGSEAWCPEYDVLCPLRFMSWLFYVRQSQLGRSGQIGLLRSDIIVRDYTNPYLPVNPSAIDGTMQATLGTDGNKKEPESNVLLASIENMQYAVTVDVLHTVFSAFGTVQKIAMFEKNGGMQALVQYPDVTIAAVAKEALEGHCIYDGGYCKLHLSYSRHTDLSVKAHNDRSRDYTVPDPAPFPFPMQQAPAVPTVMGGWQNPQTAPAYPGTGVAPHAHPPHGSWDPSMQASRPTFVSVPSTFPGQTFNSPTNVPTYSSGAVPGSSPLQQHQYPSPRPGGAPLSGQPPYYGQ